LLATILNCLTPEISCSTETLLPDIVSCPEIQQKTVYLVRTKKNAQKPNMAKQYKEVNIRNMLIKQSKDRTRITIAADRPLLSTLKRQWGFILSSQKNI
jgi:hypothetical protein